ncbi:MAG TPA: amidohydrolase family protein [Hyphomonas sp.]|nr:amidohydrolase family protein [Hyphomonas sp.]
MKKWLLIMAGLIAALSVGLLAAVLALFPPALVVAPSKDLVLSGVTIFNPGAARLEDQTIVVRAGEIVEVRPRDPSDPQPLCEDCIAMPGLIDAHVHTPPKSIVGNQALFSLLYLAHGVTSVRDTGEADSSVESLAGRLNSGRMLGPHMYRCGRVIESAPASWPAALVVETKDDAAAAVDRMADTGVDCIKVYNELNADAFQGVAEAAHRHGLPLIGHVPHPVGLKGVRDFESQHMTGLPYLSHPRPELNMDIRDDDVLAMTDEDVIRALDLAVANNISFTPTLANLSLRLSASDPTRFPPPEHGDLPDFWPDVWQTLTGHPTGEEGIERRLDSVPRYRKMVGQARARGIDVLAGTDTLMPWVMPGTSLRQEIGELALAFGSNEAALEAATRVNGDHIDPGRVGVIAPGMRADILLLREDPVVDLGALDRWAFVVADGRVYSRDEMEANLMRYRRHFHGGFYSSIMNRVVSLVTSDSHHAHAEE